MFNLKLPQVKYQIDGKSGAPMPVPLNDTQAKVIYDHCQKAMAGAGGSILSALRMDATGALALERELTHISALTSLEVYSELTSEYHFPDTPDRPALWDKAYIATGAQFQQGRVSTSYTDRGTSVAMTRKILATNPIVPAILAADYTIEEIGAAAQANLPLNALLMQAARRGVATEINKRNWFGNDDEGIIGIYNNSEISKAVVPNGAGGSPLWINKTPTEVYDDVANAVKERWAAVKGGGTTIAGGVDLLRPNRVVMGVTAYAYIAQTPMAANAQRGVYSILEALQNNLSKAYPGLEIRSAPELDSGGGPGGADAWMVVYRYDSQVCGRVVALPGQFTPPNIENLVTLVNYHARTGGVSTRYPVAVGIKYGM